MLGWMKPQAGRYRFVKKTMAEDMADEWVLPPALNSAQTVVPELAPPGVVRLDPADVAATKESFSVRRAPKEEMRTLISGAVRVRAGDIVLARVDRLRQHPRLELPSGRKAALHPGEEIIVACGARYASDQFEAFVPESLGRAHLVAAGGIAAVMTARANRMLPATEITLLGLIGDGRGVPLNLRQFIIPPPTLGSQPRPRIIGVFGTSMNSGKTTTARYMVRGLRAAGLRVGYAKVTGTGSGGDYWSMVDAGASAVVDFTDAGHASTYMAPISAIEKLAIQLLIHLTVDGCQAIIVEVADGILQRETAAVLRSETFKSLLDRVLFAAGDPLAAASGVASLRALGFDVAAVSGLVTASPLPLREAREIVDVEVLTSEELETPTIALNIAQMNPPKPAIREARCYSANVSLQYATNGVASRD